MHRTKFLATLLLAGTFLTACSLSPDYKKPETATPAKYKEANDLEGKWQLAVKEPGKADLTSWWTIFNDPELNRLQEAAAKSNNTLKAANARVTQARALSKQATSVFVPSIDALGNAARSDLQGGNGKPSNSFLIGGAVSYEANTLFQMRDIAASAKATTESAEALYRQAMLIVHADVAQSYFTLLSLDTERDLLRDTISLREKSEKLIQSRFKEGEAGEQDYLRAKAETESTRADLKALDQQRALVEHALAVLTGQAPSDFAIANTKLPESLPRIPAGLPSSLLERRPDVAAAEQQLIDANARIGIARAAFFPSISLTALGGLASDDLGDLFKWSSRAWTLGPLFGTAFSMPIFDNGRRMAGVDYAKARYEESVADYRQQVLVAFKDVEDALASLNAQAEQAKHLYASATAATKASDISDLRYREGETSYLEVLDTQRDALVVQRAYTQVQGARFRATVELIRALGGGWINVASTAVEQPKTPKPEPKTEVVQENKEVTVSEPKQTEEPTPLAKPKAEDEMKPSVKTEVPSKSAASAPPVVAPKSTTAEPQMLQKPAPVTPQTIETPSDASMLFD